MGDIVDKTQALIDSLGDLSPLGEQLAATALALASEADNPAADQWGQPKSISSTTNALRATTAELVERGRLSDDQDEDDWQSAAAGAGATPIRNTA